MNQSLISTSRSYDTAPGTRGKRGERSLVDYGYSSRIAMGSEGLRVEKGGKGV